MSRAVTIRQSFHRHNHVLGCERELVLSSGLLCFIVGIGGMSVASAISAISFWLISLFVLHQMAKADPIMSLVWRKHIKHQDFYSAKSSRWRTVPTNW